jgi:23S rRNA pseudouridine2605 synthase
MTHHDDQPDNRERLQRVLAARGVASRRAAEQLIVAGRVSVNGRAVTELGTKVDPIADVIRVDGQVVRQPKPRSVILNKPSGFITTVKDERDRWTVLDLVKVPEHIYPVGRLDRETQGLLLLTNDGELAHRVMHPRYRLAKEYHVFAGKRPTDPQLQRLRDGIEIDGRFVRPDECRLLRETSEGVIVKVVLHEGLYHVVRRMMEIVGIEVTRLQRVRIGPLRIQGIPSGAWRDLTPGELEQLFDAVHLPAEAAARANERRTIQLTPVGGYHHAGGGGQAAAEPRAAAPKERPSAQRRPQPAANRPNDRRDRRAKPGSTHDRHQSGRPGRSGAPRRSPAGDRDRRPRRGR